MSDHKTPAPLTAAEMAAEIERLRSENAALRVESQAKIRFAVSEKGAVSVTGLQAFPVTLYRSQWERLIPEMPRLQAFIAANASRLKDKRAEQIKAALVAEAEARAK